MSLVRFKYFVIGDNIEVMYDLQGNDNMIVFDTATGSDDESFAFLGMEMSELPYVYEHDYLGVNGVVTCFGLDDGIRVTDTDSQGFRHWIYVPESNPLFNLDFTDLIDAISEDHYRRAGRLIMPIRRFIKKPLERKILLAYKAATKPRPKRP